MKKKVTRPDGTVEEIEGTAEEFAEIEKQKKSSKKESKSPSRRVLTDEIQRLKSENEALKKQLEAATSENSRKFLEQLPFYPPYVPVHPNPWWTGDPPLPFIVGTWCDTKSSS